MKKHLIVSILILLFLYSSINLLSIERELILVEQGDFIMGDWLPAFNIPEGYENLKDLTGDHETDITFDARILHEVALSSYFISPYETTFHEFDEYCQATGDTLHFDEEWGRNDRPAIHVSWYDAVKYCNWLSDQDGLSRCYLINDYNVELISETNGYRLPTEAEWEYAARGGHLLNSDINDGYGNIYSGTSIDYEAPNYMWYRNNSAVGDELPGDGRSHPVGQKMPNELGLYDMSGNTWEWCWDLWNPDYYQYCLENSQESENPTGFIEPYNDGEYIYQYARVLRGASWANLNPFFRTTFRFFSQRQVLTNDPEYKNWRIGFRVCRSNFETLNHDNSNENSGIEASVFPNPLSINSTSSNTILIIYKLETLSKMNIDFYNIRGQHIDHFEHYPNRNNGKISFDSKKLSHKFQFSGVYFYRIKSSSSQFIGKVLVLRK